MQNSEQSTTRTKKIALLAGATGLVGREILHLLSRDPMIVEVRTLVRHPLPEQNKGQKVVECVADFEHLQQHPDWFNVDLVFSALGTTIARAGSQAAFRRVDLEYPLLIAKLARAAGARHFLFVSAVSANSRSPIFYNRVKGELEDAVQALGYPSVTMARPSLLLGKRHEYRLGEELAKRLSWLLPSPWRGVQASLVASALVRAAHEEKPGVEILNNIRMRQGS